MPKYTKDELVLIWLDSFGEIEYSRKQDLYKLLSGKTDLKTVIAKNKDAIVSLTDEKVFGILLNSANAVYLDYVLQSLSKRGITAITVLSPDYPKSLIETPLPPLVLYVKGDVKLLDGQAFAIVGSRKSLPKAIFHAETYARELINAGFIPITGTAQGVDETVLKAALKENAKAIAVVAGGFDHVYPQTNAHLIEEISENGLIISEYPPAVSPKPYFFPIRNRIIAALSVGALIVSAGIKSGAIYTAEYAEEYGKQVFAIPYDIGVASGEGCNDLIKRFAMLTDSPKDVLSFYGKEEKENAIELSEDENEIMGILKNGALHIEEIADALKKEIFEIAPTLSMLEIKGLIYKSGTNAYGRT